ncbi:MAG: hypothetical protein ACI9BW_002266 [Gammaproteobacteria bacterium]
MVDFDYEDLLRFWFTNAPRDPAKVTKQFNLWFNTTADFDRRINEKFSAMLEHAIAGNLDQWATTARGSLALIILFDQITRTIYRGEARAFECDHRALEIAENSIASGFDLEVEFIERLMFYLPFEHGEDIEIQNKCGAYFQMLDDIAPPGFKSITQSCVKSGSEHRDVIKRFGRFPHRNKTLGRHSTVEEIAWASDHHGWGQTLNK